MGILERIQENIERLKLDEITRLCELETMALENTRLKKEVKAMVSTLVNIKMSLMLCTSRHLDNLALANISRIDQTLKKVSV